MYAILAVNRSFFPMAISRGHEKRLVSFSQQVAMRALPMDDEALIGILLDMRFLAVCFLSDAKSARQLGSVLGRGHILATYSMIRIALVC